MCTSDIYTDSTLVHHESKHIERRGVEKRRRTGGEKGGGPPRRLDGTRASSKAAHAHWEVSSLTSMHQPPPASLKTSPLMG